MTSTSSGSVSNELEGYGSTSKSDHSRNIVAVQTEDTEPASLVTWSFRTSPSMKRLRSSFSTTISRRRTNVISQDLTPLDFSPGVSENSTNAVASEGSTGQIGLNVDPHATK